MSDYRINVPLSDAARVRLLAFQSEIAATSPAGIAPTLPAIAAVVMERGLDAIDAQTEAALPPAFRKPTKAPAKRAKRAA